MGGPIPPSPIFFLAVSYGRAAAPYLRDKKIGAPSRSPNFLTLVRRGKEDSTHGSIFFLCGRCPREKKCKSQSVRQYHKANHILSLRMPFRSRDFHHANIFNHSFFANIIPLARLLRMGRLVYFCRSSSFCYASCNRPAAHPRRIGFPCQSFPKVFQFAGAFGPGDQSGPFPRGKTPISHSNQNIENKQQQKQNKKNTVRQCRTAPKL